MTWDDWSDKQINSAIVKLKGYRVCEESNVSEEAWNHPTKCCYGTFPPENTKKYGNSYIGWLDSKDYCNSWADMGPIIVEYRIDIYFDDFGYAEACKSWNYGQGLEFKDKNPLRAAAIVFLMMKGVKPDERI